MYTIIMNEDKSLIASVTETIYQRENLVDKIQFLCPLKHNDISLADYKAILKYIDQGNELHFEVLARDSELYKNKLRYVLPVDTKLTRFAGNISVRLMFTQDTSSDALLNPVLKTGDCVITVLKDDTLICSPELISSIAELENRINETEASVDELKSVKADNISYNEETNELLLKAGDKVIDAAILEECDCEEGIPVVDFTVLEPDNPDDNIVDNVVEF